MADAQQAAAGAAGAGADNPENRPRRPGSADDDEAKVKNRVPSLEDTCIDAYLKFLEAEVVAYIGLTQTESKVLRGIASRMVAALKSNLNSSMSGIASKHIRQKMLKLILGSGKYPSPQHCNMFVHGKSGRHGESKRRRRPSAAAAAAAQGQDDVLVLGLGAAAPAGGAPAQGGDEDHEDPALAAAAMAPIGPHGLYSNCPNACCTGAFIQEAMSGIVMSADLHELIFTNETVKSRRQNCLDFNVPVVLTHLLSATHQRFSQLERLHFSENFVKDDTDVEGMSKRFRCLHVNPAGGHHDVLSTCPRGILENQLRRQDKFTKHFAAVPIHEVSSHLGPHCSDRTGLAMGLMVMFRDVAPRSPQQQLPLGASVSSQEGFYKLTEIVLKNNIQCPLYSKASFQFELLARIGFCCPRLRILDLFGTDTWADCLVAFFFRDAFHSLHRYLFFMENEDDENSAYHPHDLSRYCQFCLDRFSSCTTALGVERHFTINPVIPLIDPIYDHVIKKYPKRSYCILRNCVKVSDLINCPKSTVFELLRSEEEAAAAVDPLRLDHQPQPENIKHRLRSRAVKPQSDEKGAGSSQSAKNSGKKQPVVAKNCEKALLVENEVKTKRRSLRLQAREPEEVAESGAKTEEAGGNPRKRPRTRAAAAPNRSPYNSRSSKRIKKAEEVLVKGGSDSSGTSDDDDDDDKKGKKKAVAVAGPSGGGRVRGEPRILEQVTFDEWHRQTNRKWSEMKSAPPPPTGPCVCGGGGGKSNNSGDNSGCSSSKQPSGEQGAAPCTGANTADSFNEFIQTKNVSYREITGWPHLNDCIETLEILNIGGTNVLGEFIPFVLLYTKKLKSLGQWINTLIYGLELLRQLPGHSDTTFPQIREFSYSTDRNYFCQPYIGFVPESPEYRNVRKEMVRQSSKVAKRLSCAPRNHDSKKQQLIDDINLMVDTCPNVRKLNMVIHHKLKVIEETVDTPWLGLKKWAHLKELDLVTFRFANVWSLLELIGPQLTLLTLELDDEQGNGSEIVHIAKNCAQLRQLRLLVGHKILRGDMTLHFQTPYFRWLEKLTVEGSVHIHLFVFLWGHCHNLRYMKMGHVVSTEVGTTNALGYDVFHLLLQVNKMEQLEELHIKNLKIKSLQLGKLLLDNLPKLAKASNWILEMFDLAELAHMKKLIETCRVNRGLVIEVNDES